MAEGEIIQPHAAASGRTGRSAALGFIFATALMDVISLGIIIPVLPNLIKQMAGGSTAEALHYVLIFSTTWALMQFFASPIVGSLSDRFGRRPVLLISIFGLGCGALGFLVYALAPTGLLFWCGLPVFALMGLVQPSSQALMSRRAPANEQGRLQGATSGIMSITGLIGPSLFTSVFAWAITGGAGLGQPGLGILLAAVLVLLALGLAVRFARPPAPAPG